MAGGTTFHFTDEPVETVLRRAFEAAVIQQHLRVQLIDEMHLVIAPLLIARRERLLDNPGEGADGYRVAEMVSSPKVTHVVLALVRR
jgi:hypothetical protein